MSKFPRELPQDPTANKAVKAAIQEIVDALLEEASAKELANDIRDQTAEKYEVDPSYIMKLAKFKFDQEYNEAKATQRAEETAEIAELARDL